MPADETGVLLLAKCSLTLNYFHDNDAPVSFLQDFMFFPLAPRAESDCAKRSEGNNKNIST
jgi:hypothetical protein